MSEDRKPFWVKCEPCGHIWAAAYLPMEMSKAAKLLSRCQCPNCGNGPKKIGIAKQDDGKLLEVA